MNEFNLINKMTQDLIKAAFKKTIMKLFSLQFEDLAKEENYIELLKLCKNNIGLDVKKWLTLRALEIIFIENDKFKANLENKEAAKYFDYLIDRKAYASDKTFQNDFKKFIASQKYSVIFEKFDINPKDKQILEFICEITKNIKIVLECIDFICAKLISNYIRSQCNYEFPGKFEDYLKQLKSFFQNCEPDHTKEYISLEYNDKEKFHFNYYSYEEAESLNEKIAKPTTFKDIKKYISKNSITVLNPQKEENKAQSSFEIKEYEPLKKKDDDIKSPKQTAAINNKIEQNEIKENKNEEEIKLDFKERQLLAYIKKEYDEKFRLLDMKIISLQNENDNQNKKIASLQNENDKIKLNNNNLNNKIMSMIKYHESDMNLLKNEISKIKNKCR